MEDIQWNINFVNQPYICLCFLMRKSSIEMVDFPARRGLLLEGRDFPYSL